MKLNRSFDITIQAPCTNFGVARNDVRSGEAVAIAIADGE